MLRTQVQASPRIAFAFAGLHTLEEMTEDYFQPFFASIIPLPVSFLSRGSTAQLLANPDVKLDEEVLLEAIKGLKRHDVVEEKAGNLRILVELFRLWLEKKPDFSGGSSK